MTTPNSSRTIDKITLKKYLTLYYILFVGTEMTPQIKELFIPANLEKIRSNIEDALNELGVNPETLKSKRFNLNE
jgi:hypothetical protein